MTEQSSPVPSKAHAPSPLDIPARAAVAKSAPPRPAAAAQPTAQSAGPVQPADAQQPAVPPRPHHAIPVPVRVTGAQALVMALERVGVEVVFGIPGGAVLPAYDPLLDSKQIRHILVLGWRAES